MISLGHNCAISVALRQINTIQPSLPFDFIGNHNADSLWNIFQILDQLRQNTLDVQKFVTIDHNILNESRFHFSHFYKKGNKHLNLRLDNQEEIKETILELFTKRFARLQSKIFFEPNLLIYLYNEKFGEDIDRTIEVSHRIINMNPLNYLLILGSGKSCQISSNIELIRAKRKSSKAIKANLSHYLSQKSEEWKTYYSS